MTTVDEETVLWGDPRWESSGVTVKRREWWTRAGYLRADVIHPGSGANRRWPVGEIEVAARMVRLVKAGFRPVQAAVIARASGPVEVGPGVWVGLADQEPMPEVCELCHERSPVEVCAGTAMCAECARVAEYWENLTPAERRAEDEAIAVYMAETEAYDA